MTDVLLRQTNDGGDIAIQGGLLLLAEGLETAVYLSLFGGNDDDPGQEDRSLEWWGNLLDVEAERQYRSETQFLLRSLPAIPANLKRIEQAAARDLSWMLGASLAKSISIEATIPALGRVLIAIIIITALDQRIELFFG